MKENASNLRGIDHLIAVMARLRSPQGGCPWDLEQTFASIAPYTLEETYELVEAIEHNDIVHIKEELGDVLFQVAFHARMGQEAGLFDLDSIAQDVADKMIERHPHVFGARDVDNAGDVAANWEADKEAKRQAAAARENRVASALDGVSTALPAATRAVKLQSRAAKAGFDWNNPRDVIAKIHEEIGELEHEFAIAAPDADAVEDEMGDVLFAVVNLARKLNVDPETALRRTNRKFERRFRGIETRLAAQGRTLSDASLDDMERIWNDIKAEEKSVIKAG
ncbi:MAG: nucleoside triphosphate pyrophosphohydrolase [Alphaproteobacteria bacterium]|nr:nucleoside triphosphate pyrophosphohydrolase [Alphaproteobacteria bacterium]